MTYGMRFVASHFLLLAFLLNFKLHLAPAYTSSIVMFRIVMLNMLKWISFHPQFPPLELLAFLTIPSCKILHTTQWRSSSTVWEAEEMS